MPRRDTLPRAGAPPVLAADTLAAGALDPLTAVHVARAACVSNCNQPSQRAAARRRAGCDAGALAATKQELHELMYGNEADDPEQPGTLQQLLDHRRVRGCANCDSGTCMLYSHCLPLEQLREELLSLAAMRPHHSSLRALGTRLRNKLVDDALVLFLEQRAQSRCFGGDRLVKVGQHFAKSKRRLCADDGVTFVDANGALVNLGVDAKRAERKGLVMATRRAA